MVGRTRKARPLSVSFCDRQGGNQGMGGTSIERLNMEAVVTFVYCSLFFFFLFFSFPIALFSYSHILPTAS